MKLRLVKVFAVIGVLALMAGVGGISYLLSAGVSAKPQPGPIETVAARTLRNIALRWHAEHFENPEPATTEIIAGARAHFADHCASCHANDGSGNTEMGRGLYPKAPDMRLAATQKLTDHELFYIIENGIRLTGMPAWGTGTRAGEDASWQLVHFIRHLPNATEEEIEEMKAMNPRSPAEIRQEIEAERFLSGEDPAPAQAEHAGGHAHE